MILFADHSLLSSVVSKPFVASENGIPRFWATCWAILYLENLKPSTARKKLQAINQLYLHADALYDGESMDVLDDALTELDEVRIAAILESWFISLRNRPGSKANEDRWITGRDFATSIVTLIAKSDSNSVLRNVESRLIQLSLLYGQLHIEPRRKVQGIRALPASVIEALYELLDPQSPNNPFVRDRARWQYYVAFVLMLHAGLRRGELLVLPVNAVKNAFDRRLNQSRFWLNVREIPEEDSIFDFRYSPASIKTADSYRQLPVSSTIASAVDIYTENYRGKPEHPFLMNSQLNNPLSHEQLTKVFKQISECLPTNIQKELKDRTGKQTITPHDLRHTCATFRLNQFLTKESMDMALQKLRIFFGWSRTSNMPLHYARATFEDRLADVWNAAFDDRVSVMRALPREL